MSQTSLTQLEGNILNLRNGVSHCKKDRDNIRDDNKELKVKQGFASNELLISDFEKRKRTILSTSDRVRDLQARHHALSIQANMNYNSNSNINNGNNNQNNFSNNNNNNMPQKNSKTNGGAYPPYP